jgi:hypothetical protein
VDVSSNVITGADIFLMVNGTKQMLLRGNGWKNFFGD